MRVRRLVSGVLLWAVAAAVAEAHVGESWNSGHTVHLEVKRVEGYVIDTDAVFTVLGKELRGKFSLPVVIENYPTEDEYYAYGDGEIPDYLYEDVGENGCVDLRHLAAAGDATFTSGELSIRVKNFPLAEFPRYYGGGLRLKIFYSYREHGTQQSVEKVAWTEC